MKFICDVHIPIRLSKFFATQGVESVHVNQILAGSSTPRKLIRVCLGNIPNDKLIQLFETRLPLIRQLNAEGSFYTEINPGTVLLFYQ